MVAELVNDDLRKLCFHCYMYFQEEFSSFRVSFALLTAIIFQNWHRSIRAELTFCVFVYCFSPSFYCGVFTGLSGINQIFTQVLEKSSVCLVNLYLRLYLTRLSNSPIIQDLDIFIFCTSTLPLAI